MITVELFDGQDNDDCNANLRVGNISMDPVASQDPNCFDNIGIARIGYRGGNIEDKVNEASIRKSKNFAAGNISNYIYRKSTNT